MQNHLSVLRNCPFFTGLHEDEILSILHMYRQSKLPASAGLIFSAPGDSTEVMGLVLSVPPL